MRKEHDAVLALADHGTLARAEARQAQARGDGVQPRRELRVSAELRQRPVSPEEHLLGDLLGLGGVAQHADGDPEHAVLMGANQLLEGLRLAGP